MDNLCGPKMYLYVMKIWTYMTCVSAMLITIIIDFSSLVVGKSNESLSGKKSKYLQVFGCLMIGQLYGSCYL